ASMESLLRRQLPDLEVVRLPRLSELRHLGPSSLRTLPKRSAVVAFSMPEVYRLADALRRRRGGAAVVLGALSPRVRNAQVALYRNADLDYASLAALLKSLARRPRDDSLRPAPEGDDIEVLRCMAKRGVVAELDELRLRALWDICRVPNYEKRLPEHQAEAL